MVAPFAPIEADPEAGWWVEAWDIDNANPMIRGIPVLAGPWQRVLNDLGDGSITIPAPDPRQPRRVSTGTERSATHPTTSPPCSRSTSTAATRTASGQTRSPTPYGEPSEMVVDISGRGIRSHHGLGPPLPPRLRPGQPARLDPVPRLELRLQPELPRDLRGGRHRRPRLGVAQTVASNRPSPPENSSSPRTASTPACNAPTRSRPRPARSSPGTWRSSAPSPACASPPAPTSEAPPKRS